MGYGTLKSLLRGGTPNFEFMESRDTLETFNQSDVGVLYEKVQNTLKWDYIRVEV